MGFKLPELNFSYDALEPSIDAKTMEIHHSKHHNGYTNNLNNAIKDTDLDSSSIEAILVNLDMNNKGLRNNAGGYYNHKLFWEVISPVDNNDISVTMLDCINASFGSFDSFKEQFSKAAATQFGSGWAWLCVMADGKLKVCATANQDNPIMPSIGCGGTPILGLDVWEHAYYLNYQNRRVDYISAFMDLINWKVVEENYLSR
ncbi:superoxide dismutase [Flavobacteriaceae bacterium]|nr:superoxide dismutase [Flavobacteriaceae bacterium]